MKYLLGIEVLDIDNGVCLSQRKYCMELLHDFGMLGCKPINTPLEGNFVPKRDTDLLGEELVENVTEFQKLIGKLIYLTVTRPDIAYAIQVLSQFMHKPYKYHFNIAFRVLRYLKNSPGKGINIQKGDVFDLKAYVDGDWANACLLESL